MVCCPTCNYLLIIIIMRLRFFTRWAQRGTPPHLIKVRLAQRPASWPRTRTRTALWYPPRRAPSPCWRAGAPPLLPFSYCAAAAPAPALAAAAHWLAPIPSSGAFLCAASTCAIISSLLATIAMPQSSRGTPPPRRPQPPPPPRRQPCTCPSASLRSARSQVHPSGPCRWALGARGASVLPAHTLYRCRIREG